MRLMVFVSIDILLACLASWRMMVSGSQGVLKFVDSYSELMISSKKPTCTSFLIEPDLTFHWIRPRKARLASPGYSQVPAAFPGNRSFSFNIYDSHSHESSENKHSVQHCRRLLHWRTGRKDAA